MLSSNKISAADWEKYQRNQKLFSRLSEIIDEIDDITFSLNGWGDKPYQSGEDIPLKIAHPENTKEEKIAPIEFPCVIQVLENCSKALNDRLWRFQNENLKIVGIK
ncbi:MAG TPA: hypothetical protein ACFYEK_01175 [Candidatus Wunengus sp. YC60]|uniref:hypothetical protein n=1 Tax=Candidatus Wunengus sp. YC60 TaxID=3367697 RepID=UPI004029D811